MAGNDSEPPCPDNPDSAIAEAVGLHRAGRLTEAAARYRDILRAHKDHSGVLHNLGVVTAQGGEHAAALDYFDKALVARPDYASAFLNKAGVLRELERPDDAIDCYDRALSLDPDLVAAHVGRADTLARSGRLNEASDGYRRALDVAPEHYDALFRLGLAENALGRRHSALACFARTNEIRRAAATVSSISRHKLDHDIAQFGFLISSGHDRDRLSRLADEFSALENNIDWPDDDSEPVALTVEQSGRIAATFTRPVHLADAPGTAVSSLDPGLDAAAITSDYFGRRPGVARVDDLLAPDALRSLRRFLLHGTIWFDFTHVRGFLAAYLEDGLACPLLLQIAADLGATFPEILGDHALCQAWAFKCVGGHDSVDLHVDSAAVVVNFWITPDAANLDPEHGGLILYDTLPPPDWRIAGYGQDAGAIREFLARNDSARTIVPHRENRALIFDSNLFHGSDTVDFRPGYENHRINVTMLFGQRGE